MNNIKNKNSTFATLYQSKNNYEGEEQSEKNCEGEEQTKKKCEGEKQRPNNEKNAKFWGVGGSNLAQIGQCWYTKKLKTDIEATRHDPDLP